MYRNGNSQGTFFGVVAACLIVVSSVAGAFVLANADRDRSGKAALAESEAHLAKGEAALAAVLRERQADGAAAASLAPLRALLASLRSQDRLGPLAATLRDAFASESWWQSVRREFPLTVISLDGKTVDFATDKRASAAPVADFLATARSTGDSTGVILGDAGAWLATVHPVSVPNHSMAPVLCLVEPLDESKLRALLPGPGDAIALERAGRVVLATGAGWALEAITGQGRPRSPDAPVITIARRSHDGWSLLVATDVTAAMGAAQLGPDPRWLAGLGIGLAVVVLWFARRRRTRLLDEVDLARSDLSAKVSPQAKVSTSVASSEPTDDKLASLGATIEAGNPPSEQAAQGKRSGPGLGIVGRYTLIDRLGEGGMAQVFTAVAHGAEGFHRKFVVKRLRPELTSNRAAVTQFIDEAKLGASLVHSNIIPVFDFGRAGDEYFIAMEYILGRDLERLVGRSLQAGQSAMPLPIVLFVLAETLKALDYAHTRCSDDGRPLGLVHRDISPSNILMSMRGEVKLFDFGIVKAEGRTSKTEHGMVKGNVNFMSPEQARGQLTDARSDLFSLGLVTYFCATGRTLYRGQSAYDLLIAAAAGPSASDREHFAALPEPLPGLLRFSLQQDPNARFASAEQFAHALAGGAHATNQEAAQFVQGLAGDELAAEEARLVRSTSWSQQPIVPDGKLGSGQATGATH